MPLRENVASLISTSKKISDTEEVANLESNSRIEEAYLNTSHFSNIPVSTEYPNGKITNESDTEDLTNAHNLTCDYQIRKEQNKIGTVSSENAFSNDCFKNTPNLNRNKSKDFEDISLDPGNDIPLYPGDHISLQKQSGHSNISVQSEVISLQKQSGQSNISVQSEVISVPKKRNRSGKATLPKPKAIGWTKKYIRNPFKQAPKNNSFIDIELKNRASEVRFVYYNMPLPNELLDEEGDPIIHYCRNKIKTTKYSPLNFLPRNIWGQFHNFANIYFLLLIILGYFRIFGVVRPVVSSIPLIVILLITALKDAIEDSRRTALDLEVNNTRTHLLTGISNGNVSIGTISKWRKLKKATSRFSVRFFQYYKYYFIQKDRIKRKQRNHHGLPIPPTPSYDSITGDNLSLNTCRSFTECGLLDYIGSTNNTSNVLDKNLPIKDDCKFARDYWKNIQVGDILRIHNNEEVPADIILISTTEHDGTCYLETKNLDGETNLKARRSLKCTKCIRNSRDVAKAKFWVESEGPHANLYTYQGNLKWNDSSKDDSSNTPSNEPININNMLLRGCTLRNTKWAMGVVMFTGDDTKIMLNSGITPTKKSRISRELNFSVILNFVLLFFLCFVSALVNGIYYSSGPNARDFFEFGTIGGTVGLNGFISFWVAVILYQSLVPISLYISVEVIKTAQAAFIYGDVLLYDPKLDYPCTPKTWNISDDLGQVEYIFSDKTGTLTQNVMEYKKCTINGVSYGRAYTEALAGLRRRQGIDVESESIREKAEIAADREEMIDQLRDLSSNSQFYPKEITFISKEFVNDLDGASGDFQQSCCEHFMLTLALCHSVLVEPNKHDSNKLDFKAQSPDEAALVGTARDMGFSFVGKTKRGVIVEIQGVQKEFEILNILEFNSSRKRMSCIVKIPSLDRDEKPKALLICKGADSVIYSRLSRKSGVNDPKILQKTALQLEQYAMEGLRTLCLVQRELDWDEYEEWNNKYNIAASSLEDRDAELDQVADSIERELVLLGGTAIEDRLQDGVPDSIALLAEAGIKLWVLTGDKVETAINIGFSCNLLNKEMHLLVVKPTASDDQDLGDTSEQITENLLSKYLQDYFGLTGSERELGKAKEQHGFPKGNYAVIIDGDALKIALHGEDIRRKFLILCKNCRAVLCCRVSPSQKAAVVKLVKNTLDVMTLAIGDGSNDVAMIQAADIGVGIAGEEGRQAVMSSDFAIGQFRFLSRILLVHGKWAYKRLAEMIPQFFYKNVIFTLASFWYGIFNNFDGSYLYEYTYLLFYNLVFTTFPVISLGVLDQDVSDTISMVAPQLYRVGILRLEWNQHKFLWYMLDGLYQTVICFFFPFLVYYKTNLVTNNGLGLNHRFYVGVMVATIAIMTCNLYVFQHQYRWDWLSVLFVVLSILSIFFWTGIWTLSLTSREFFKAGSRIYGTPSFWAVLIVGVTFCLLPRFIFDVLLKILKPADIDIAREMWCRGYFDQYPPGYDPTDPDRPVISKTGNLGERIVPNLSSTDLLTSRSGSRIFDVNATPIHEAVKGRGSNLEQEIPMDLLPN